VLALVAFLVLARMADRQTGLYCLGGMVALAFLASILASSALALARRLRIGPLLPRLALRGLSRPGNASAAVITTLATALALLLTMFLVRKNLEDNYIASFPPDAPNVFVLNIQKDEEERFQQLVAVPCRLYPVIRGRLKAINGQPVAAERDGKPAIDTLTREFSLTYQDELLADEHLIAGKSLFKKDDDGNMAPQVSVLNTVRDMGKMRLGDVLTFSIQGVPLEAEITSIRARNHAGPSPFFFFVLPPQYLAKAPQNAFAAIKVPPDKVAGLQNLLAAKMPHLSVLDLGTLAAEMGNITGKFVRLINFFAGLSIVAGLLILWGSLLASRLPRLAEAVYYRVMGASRAFILVVFLVENLALGLTASLVAMVIAQPAAWLLCSHGLNLDYRPFWIASLILAAGATLFTGLAALPAGGGPSAARQSLATSLKEQAEE
jgi:putative ABC transport system permease protein